MTISYRVLCLLILGTFLSYAQQDSSQGSIWGSVIVDYFYKLKGDTTRSGSTIQYSTPVQQDDQAFQIRRLFLGYNYSFSKNIHGEIVFESNDKSLDASGRYTTFLKRAFLEWKDIFSGSDLSFGLIPTPTWLWSLSDKAWGYRSLEKTICDQRGLGSGSDLGIALRGTFDQDRQLTYVAMIGNGSGPKPEDNRYKKFYGSMNAAPSKEVSLELYADYESGSNSRSILTTKGIASLQLSHHILGLELVQQRRKKQEVNGSDRLITGLSCFARIRIKIVENLTGIVRYDRFNPDSNELKGYTEHFFLIGLDYQPIQSIHIMPNVWSNAFTMKEPGTIEKQPDVVARLTLYFSSK
ncbi:MAG: hypothetical protein V1799_00215 [bacterium]